MVRVRVAKPSDTEAIAKIYVETWRTTYAGLLPDRVLIEMSGRRQMAAWSRAIRAPAAGHDVLVAEDRQAGTLGFGSCGRSRAISLPFKGEVYTLYVLPDRQGENVGRTLLGGLFKRLRERDMGSVLIWVLAGNPARFFYEAMGGARVAERKERLWGTELDEVAYGWPNLERMEALSTTP